MNQIFLILLISFVTFDFFLERILAWLNLKALKGSLPEALSGFMMLRNISGRRIMNVLSKNSP